MPVGTNEQLSLDVAERFARILLDCVHREYPNKTSHVVESDADVRPPRELTPSFFGSFDWHSAVHGHWSLVRLLRCAPDGRFADEARVALDTSFEASKLAREAAFQAAQGVGWEMPYGVAWCLLLGAELQRLAAAAGPDTERGARWLHAFEPLEAQCAERFAAWLSALPCAIRSGEHSQTAFAMGFVLDWARARERTDVVELVERTARRFHEGDVAAPLAYEPSAHDFLSPSLAAADLLARVLAPDEFARWATGYFGELPSSTWTTPVTSADPSDGKLAHFQGLNLSRAWMMNGIAAALGPDDPRADFVRRSAAAHRDHGVPAVTGEHYAGAHWLASFALYLLSNARFD